jgi:hypothetical protein
MSFVFFWRILSGFCAVSLVEKSAEKPFDIAQRISFSHIAELFRELSNVQRGLRANANRKLLLEHFFFLIP